MRRSILLTGIGLLVAIAGAAAQGGRSSDNILYPQPPLPIMIGPEIGYAMWDIDASFVVGDAALACAVFGDGEGEGPTFGMRAFVYLTPWITLTPRLRYEPRVATFDAALEGEPARDGRDSVVMLTRAGRVDATLSTYTLDLRLAVDLFESGFYLAAGTGASLVASSFFDYTERITGPQEFVHGGTGTSEEVLVSGQAFDNKQAFVLDARGGAGLLISVGPIVFNPEVSYTYPITSSLAPPDTMKQRGFSGSLGILFNFGELR